MLTKNISPFTRGLCRSILESCERHNGKKGLHNDIFKWATECECKNINQRRDLQIKIGIVFLDVQLAHYEINSMSSFFRNSA